MMLKRRKRKKKMKRKKQKQQNKAILDREMLGKANLDREMPDKAMLDKAMLEKVRLLKTERKNLETVCYKVAKIKQKHVQKNVLKNFLIVKKQLFTKE